MSRPLVFAFTAVVFLWAPPASAFDPWAPGGGDGPSDLDRLSATSSLDEASRMLGDRLERAPNNPPSDPPPPPSYPAPIPIDGGLSVLALAGVGYAARRLRARRPAAPTA